MWKSRKAFAVPLPKKMNRGYVYGGVLCLIPGQRLLFTLVQGLLLCDVAQNSAGHSHPIME